MIKKILKLSTLLAIAAVTVNCSGNHDKGNQGESIPEEYVLEEEEAEIISIEEDAPATTSRESLSKYEEGKENYSKLVETGVKCDTDQELSQSDYKFMIDFINLYLDAATEAENTGKGEEFLRETEELHEYTKVFLSIILNADQDGKLDSDNASAWKNLQQRYQNI